MRKTIFGSDLCPVIPSPHESLLTAQDDPPVRTKTFSTHVVLKKRHVVSKSGLFTHERYAFTWPPPAMNDASPGGDGGWSRHWLPKRGDPRQWGGPAEPSVPARAYKIE